MKTSEGKYWAVRSNAAGSAGREAMERAAVDVLTDANNDDRLFVLADGSGLEVRLHRNRAKASGKSGNRDAARKGLRIASSMKTPIVTTECDLSAAEGQIRSAWSTYKETEKYGLEFGRVCCEWRDKLRAQGRKGQGLRPMLDKVGIPRSTAYWWMDRYEVSIGARTEQEPELKPEPLPEAPVLPPLAGNSRQDKEVRRVHAAGKPESVESEAVTEPVIEMPRGTVRPDKLSTLVNEGPVAGVTRAFLGLIGEEVMRAVPYETMRAVYEAARKDDNEKSTQLAILWRCLETKLYNARMEETSWPRPDQAIALKEGREIMVGEQVYVVADDIDPDRNIRRLRTLKKKGLVQLSLSVRPKRQPLPSS
jgi:hypothetical protein